jgi:RND family efflux transporter MFP subunit
MYKKIISLAIISLCFLTACNGAKDKKKPKVTAPMVIGAKDLLTIENEEIKDTVSASGELVAYQEALVNSEVEGLVLATYAEEGINVSKGQVLASIDSKDLKEDYLKKKENLNIQQAEEEFSKATLNRQAAALKEDLISQQDYDSAKADHKIKLKEVEAAKADLRLSESNLKRAKVVAPISGTISKKFIKTGELSQPGKQMFEIVQTSPLELNIALPSEYLDKVKKGQSISFSLTSMPENKFNATVERIYPSADKLSRSVVVAALVSNPQGHLKVGLSVDATIQLTDKRKTIIVGSEALIDKNDKKFVYLYSPKTSSIQLSPVTLKKIDAETDRYEVLEGLSVGDKIVSIPLDKTDPRIKVQLTDLD